MKEREREREREREKKKTIGEERRGAMETARLSVNEFIPGVHQGFQDSFRGHGEKSCARYTNIFIPCMHSSLEQD